MVKVVQSVEELVLGLFGRVTEVLARATAALLEADPLLGQAVIDADQEMDEQTEAVRHLVWAKIDSERPTGAELRHLVSILLVLPELERSADLAEHIARRALNHVGAEMTPVSRGIVQRMSEVAMEMWRSVTAAYAAVALSDLELHEADEELDILHDRLTAEVATGSMSAPLAAQVALLGRFYERIGDHAVNLSRRITTFPS
ncbi:MAG: phosphate signaling complex PhoU family protein [Acidimicrobiales bacterium]